MEVVLAQLEGAERRRLAARLLENGHRLTAQTADGREALRLAEALQPDVLLCGALLPGLDGMALCRALDALALPLAPAASVVDTAGWLRAFPAARVCASETEALSFVQNAGNRPLPPATEALVDALLGRLGFSPKLRGRHWAREALLLCLRDRERLQNLRDRVYAPLAKKHGAMPSAVERDLRYAIEAVWRCGDLSALEQAFGQTVDAEKGKPTNRAFLAQCVERVRLYSAVSLGTGALGSPSGRVVTPW